jgi:hypothetical protein
MRPAAIRHRPGSADFSELPQWAPAALHAPSMTESER